MKFRKDDGVNDSAMVLLAYMEELTDPQRRRIQVLLERITNCEGSIPGKHWCDGCVDHWRKIWSIAIKFRAENQRLAARHEKFKSVFEAINQARPKHDKWRYNKGDMFKPYKRGDII